MIKHRVCGECRIVVYESVVEHRHSIPDRWHIRAINSRSAKKAFILIHDDEYDPYKGLICFTVLSYTARKFAADTSHYRANGNIQYAAGS